MKNSSIFTTILCHVVFGLIWLSFHRLQCHIAMSDVIAMSNIILHLDWYPKDFGLAIGHVLNVEAIQHQLAVNI
jgi:hypothetical protein